MDKRRATEFLGYLLRDKNIERTIYEDALKIAIESLKAQLSKENTTKDAISRQAAIEKFAMTAPQMSVIRIYEAVEILESMPTIQPELTDEQAIVHLQSSGWMQRHDKEMYESGLREQLADDSDSYDSLLPNVQSDLIEKIQAGITATNSNDAYSLGMRNGMRWCKSLIDGVEPKYEDNVTRFGDGADSAELPPVQPEPHEGHWIDKGWNGDWAWQIDGRGNCWRVIECSECGKSVSVESNYCPHCGAHMKGAEHETN